MIPITISTRGRSSGGRWYKGRNGKEDRISIFVNIIAQHIDVDSPLFEAAIGAIAFHEVVHVIGARNLCKNVAACRAGECWWCNFTEKIVEFNIPSH